MKRRSSNAGRKASRQETECYDLCTFYLFGQELKNRYQLVSKSTNIERPGTIVDKGNSTKGDSYDIDDSTAEKSSNTTSPPPPPPQ